METIIKSENALRVEGMRLLIEGLGTVNAERFINCLKSDHFDYTEWQKGLWKNRTLEEIHQAAADYFNEKHG